MSNDGSSDDSITNKMYRGQADAKWQNPKSLVGSLLEKTTSRAIRTSTNTNELDMEEDVATNDVDSNDAKSNPNVQNVIDASIVRSSSFLDKDGVVNDSSINTGGSQEGRDTNLPPKKQHQDKRTYLGNPSVTPTALAHSLWQSTILPYQDTVIDATCGNGKDCVALAKMLFPNSMNSDDDCNDDLGIVLDDDSTSPKPQLIGIDIQSRAIQNTKQSLLSSLSSDVYYNHVTILEQSHEHLMEVPRDMNSVGLICYNLGYLPGAPPANDQQTMDYKECQTQTETTLNSITDASLLLRVGGLLSIMTYPGSNLEESIVVEHFVEGLAMLTTRDVGGWRGYLDNIPNYNNDNGRVKTIVTQALERVVDEGENKQTWRAFVHKPLGRPLSPVLVTAMRIK